MDELPSEFLTETNENLGVLDVELVKLEQNPDNPELLANIFRLVHTIKGTCGFLGLPRLESVAHASENILGKFRDGDIDVNPAAVTLILESLDCIKGLLGVLEETESEPQGDDSALIAKLNEMAASGDTASATDSGPAEEQKTDKPVFPAKGTRPGEASEEELEAAFLAAKGPEDLATPVPPAQNDTDAVEILFDRVGGEAAVDAMVDIFYTKILADDSVRGFFEDVDMDVQLDKQKSFIRFALGAATEYSGSSLAEAHAPLVGKGLNDAHFDTVAVHLRETLKEIDVSDDLVEEVMSIVASTREDILTGATGSTTTVAAEKVMELENTVSEK